MSVRKIGERKNFVLEKENVNRMETMDDIRRARKMNFAKVIRQAINAIIRTGIFVWNLPCRKIMKEILIQTRNKFIMTVRLLTAPRPEILPIMEVKMLDTAITISKKYINLKSLRMRSIEETE